MFIEVLNFNQGNLGDNQLARELHTQLKDLKRVTDNWLATVGPSVDTSKFGWLYLMTIIPVIIAI